MKVYVAATIVGGAQSALFFLRRNDRIRRYLDFFALALGIAGYSIAESLQTHPWIKTVSLTLLVAALILTIIPLAEPNQFSRKSTIDRIWQEMLVGAGDSVKVFAGDASWAERDQGVIARKTAEGLPVQVLCHRPKTYPTRLRNIETLLLSGSEVRYYPQGASTHGHPYGLIVDGDGADATALRLRRQNRANLLAKENRGAGTQQSALYDYDAVRILPADDSERLSLMRSLFDSLWNAGEPVCVLRAIENDRKIGELALAALRSIPQYAHLTNADLVFRSASFEEVWASCLYVKQPKLDSVRPIVNQFVEQGIDAFEPCLCTSKGRRTVILPPIVEEHDGKLVAVDGTHRLFTLGPVMGGFKAHVLLVKNCPKLPGVPIPFQRVKAYPRHLTRPEVFLDYDPDAYRRFGPMEEVLKKAAASYSSAAWP